MDMATCLTKEIYLIEYYIPIPLLSDKLNRFF